MKTVDIETAGSHEQIDKLRHWRSFAGSIANPSSSPTQAVLKQALSVYKATSVALGSIEIKSTQRVLRWRSVEGVLTPDKLPIGVQWADAVIKRGHGSVCVLAQPIWGVSEKNDVESTAVIAFDDGAGFAGILCLFFSTPIVAINWRSNDLSELIADLALTSCVLERERDRLQRADEQAVLLTSLFNSTSEGIWSVGLDGLITFVNEAAVKMFAFDSPEQMLGRNSHELVHHSHADGSPYPMASCPIFRAFKEGVPAHLSDEVLWRADGTSFFAEYRTCPVFDQGKIVGTVTTFCDNTEKRAVGQELANHAQNLAAAVDELEKERSLRDRFTNMLTHDLRAPISAAQLNAQLLARKAGDVPVVKTVTGRIITNTKRADNLIQNLLDVNRLKAGQELPLATADVCLDALLEGAIADLNQIYGQRIDFENLAGKVNGRWDANSLLRIVDNLVGNAVKYGSTDTRITISLASRGTKATVAVHNLGAPISSGDQEILFEPFMRATTAEQTGQKGWGLGLSLVKELVHRHGGDIWCESSKRAGTTFSLELPMYSANA